MIGAIAGDIIGSYYEGKRSWMNDRHVDFHTLFHHQSRFTDDTVLTCAVADWMMNTDHSHIRVNLDSYHALERKLKEYALAYRVGYGPMFWNWVNKNTSGYYSIGNGSAMRVSSIPWLSDHINDAWDFSYVSAQPTHNISDGEYAAQIVSHFIFCSIQKNFSKFSSDHTRHDFYRHFYESNSIGSYDSFFEESKPIDEIRPAFKFDPTARGTVPAAIQCFLESDSYEHAVRLAVSLGGDTDTLACIAGSIAEACHGIPKWIEEKALSYLPAELLSIVDQFKEKTNWNNYA